MFPPPLQIAPERWCAPIASLHNDLADNLPSALVGVDLDGRVLLWNRAAESLFGWARHEVLGRQPPFVPAALHQEWRLQMRQVLDGGLGLGAAETQRLDRDGRLVPVLRSSAPFRGASGEVIGVLDTLVDITAHKQLTEESRALTQVRERELIAMDLHDGLIQSLYAVALNLSAREHAADLDVATARGLLRDARTEIQQIIEESRSYLCDLSARALAPRDLLAGMQLLIDALRLNGHIEPRVEVDPRVNDMLDADVRGHLLYIAREAISNILRHAEATAVSVQVVIVGEVVRLCVSDNGRGFVTAGRGRRGHRGLRNMASRARLVGGKLEVSSDPQAGTRIRLDIPWRRRDQAY